MKTYLKTLVAFTLIVSCQTNKKADGSLSSIIEKEHASQINSSAFSSNLNTKQTLNKAQFNDFFPKEIGDFKLVNVSVLLSSAIASALYIKNNDYNHSMTYSLEDGNRKGSAVLKNFEQAYLLKFQGPEGTEYVYTERDHYKTIAFLQPQIKRNDIRFIYNNRFRITLEGTDHVETLWTYFQKEDLKKLDNY